jgi:hypothetical protein
MVHFGVVKCLFEHKLLPPVICGASIGALVAALLGSFTSLLPLDIVAFNTLMHHVSFVALLGETHGSNSHPHG